MNRYFDIYLNAGDSIAPTIHVNQYDNSEVWYFTVYDEDGIIVVPTDASICGVKADGHIILNSAVVSGNKVLVTETKQMTASPGKATFELLLNGATHGTANFNVIVEPRPGDQSEYSASVLTLLSDAIARSQMLVNISGLTSAMKTAIIQAFENVAWDDGSGQTYIDAIINAFADGDPSGGIVIDDYLSETSPNPVENRVITQHIKALEQNMIHETVTGNPVVIEDAANLLAESVTIEYEPVQSLNGYANPWVGGTGKNLLPVGWTAGTTTINGVTFTVNSDGSVTANGTASSTATFYFNSELTTSEDMILTGCPEGGSSSKYVLWARTSSNSYRNDYGSGVTISSGTSINRFAIVILSGNTVNNLTFYPMLRPSAGSDLQLTGGYYDNADFSIASSGSAIQKSIKWQGKANTTYTVTWGVNVYVSRLIVDGVMSSNVSSNTSSYTVTPTTDGWVGLSFRDATSSSTAWDSSTSIRIEGGTAETIYEPYENICPITGGRSATLTVNGGTATMAFSTVAYKGTYDFTTGIFTATHKGITFDGVTDGLKLNYTAAVGATSNIYGLTVEDGSIYGRTSSSNGWITDATKVTQYGLWFSHGEWERTYPGGVVSPGLYAVLSGSTLQLRILFPIAWKFNTIAKANQWLNDQYTAGKPVQIVYALASPTSIQVTGSTRITLAEGENTIASDRDVTVHYIADTKLYIDSRLP